MRWIITKDHITDCDILPSCAGKGNFVLATPPLPYRFRLYDDDGELYYEGRSDDRNSDAAFAPLDWAMADSGCTRIDYLQDNGKWETL